MSAFLGTIIFILGYTFITLEHKLHVNKSAFALAMGGLLWVLVGISDPHLTEIFPEVAVDIFNIVIFLLAAMSLVEILVHYRFFDVVRDKILEYKLSNKAQFVVISILAFLFSAVIDNLTTTIVMIQIARKFFSGNNLLIAVVGIVIAANAGGAFSPIGDVTTIMLWLAGKFSALEVLTQGILPSFTLWGVMTLLLLPKIRNHGVEEYERKERTVLSKSEMVVIGLVLSSFSFPVLMKLIHLPPVVGLLFGVGLSWVLVDVLKTIRPSETHLTASIEKLIQKTDISSIKFFIGVLLAVSALGALGVLQAVSHTVYGSDPATTHIIIGNTFLGIISAVLDNIPLTAIAIQILDVASPSLWVLLALAVGTGGSLLAVGSAAGVIAMGMVKELTFSTYFRLATIPAFISFCAAIAVWGIQYSLFF